MAHALLESVRPLSVPVSNFQLIMNKLLIAALAIALPMAAHATNYTYTFSDTSDGTSSTLGSLAHGTAYTWGFTSASLGSGGNLSTLESAVSAGSQVVTSATLTLTGISDWTSEAKDVLYVDILNGLAAGAKQTTYMPALTNGDTTYYGDDPFNPNSKLSSYNPASGGSVVAYNSTLGNYNSNLVGTAGHLAFQSAVTNAALSYSIHGHAVTGQTGTSLIAPTGVTQPGTFSAANTTSTFTVSIALTQQNLNLLTDFLASDAGGSSVFGLGFGPDCHFYDTGISLKLYTSSVPDSGSTALLFGLAAIAVVAVAGKTKKALAL